MVQLVITRSSPNPGLVLLHATHLHKRWISNAKGPGRCHTWDTWALRHSCGNPIGKKLGSHGWKNCLFYCTNETWKIPDAMGETEIFHDLSVIIYPSIGIRIQRNPRGISCTAQRWFDQKRTRLPRNPALPRSVCARWNSGECGKIMEDQHVQAWHLT